MEYTSEPNAISTLLGNLERSLCARLDRIEASLRGLRTSPTTPYVTEAEVHGNNTARNLTSYSEAVPRYAAPDRAGPGRAWARKDEIATSDDEEDEAVALASYEEAAKRLEKLGRVDTSQAVCRTLKDLHVEGLRTETPIMEPTLTLRSEWQEWLLKKSSHHTVVLVNNRLGANRRFESCTSKDAVDSPRWLILPNTPFRLCWDLLTGLILAHDMAVVPINLAFEVEGNHISDALFWPFLLFWTVDIPLTFFTAIYRNGFLELRLRKIAINYMRSWLSLDLFFVGSTWLEVWADPNRNGVQLGRIGKGLRVFRVTRMLRFLRIAKLGRITEEIRHRTVSEYHSIVMTVTKLILIIVWLNHFIACGWWAVGKHATQVGYKVSWIQYYGLDGASLDDKYFTTLHWSLTQFTPAGMEVSAKNTPERIYSVCVLLFAMITFSSFVSSITAAMTQLRQLRSRRAFSYTLLRRYLETRRLPLDLTARILHCVDYRLGRQRHEVHEGEVQYLNLLSKPLRLELSLQLSGPVLMRHPLLRHYGRVGWEAMRLVCLEATERCCLSLEDTLFSEGEPSRKMFFVVSGRFRYHFRRLFCIDHQATAVVPSEDYQDEVSFLLEQEHCCEVSLWSAWVHRGTMIADRMSEVLTLDEPAFTRITCSFDTVNRFTARYGKCFLEAMEKVDIDGLNGINDMSVLAEDVLEELAERACLKQTVQQQPVDSSTGLFTI